MAHHQLESWRDLAFARDGAAAWHPCGPAGPSTSADPAAEPRPPCRAARHGRRLDAGRSPQEIRV